MLDTLKGIFTFAATIIGAGILALPVFLGSVGFLPGTLMIIFIGFACIFSALFIAETILRTKGDLHLVGLANKYLGRRGSILMFIGILIYIYGALIGYLSAGGQVIYEISQGKIPVGLGILIYFLFGALIIYFGIKAVELTSAILFTLMLFLFFGIAGFGIPYLNFDLFKSGSLEGLPGTFGILLFAFCGHTVLPSLIKTLNNKKGTIKKIAFWGVFLPLVIYIVWFFVISAIVPYGAGGIGMAQEINPLLTKTLSEAKIAGQPATIPLAHIIGGQILILAVVFTLFSTFTSYLGFGISLKDSFLDLKLKVKEILALILAVSPPLFFSLWQSTFFFKALDFAGLYGAGLFIGILPALMVIRARKKSERIPEFITPGGNIVPWSIFIIFLFGLIYNTLMPFI